MQEIGPRHVSRGVGLIRNMEESREDFECTSADDNLMLLVWDQSSRNVLGWFNLIRASFLYRAVSLNLDSGQWCFKT